MALKATWRDFRLFQKPYLSLSCRWLATQALTEEVVQDVSWGAARPYEEIPGPKPLPIIGNLHQFIPGLGEFGNMNVLAQHQALMEKYGKIVRISKVPGRRDMVFLFDPKYFEEVFRKEGAYPDRDIMQCLIYYRKVTRKDKYEGVGGLLVGYGEEWKKFRTTVNPPLMQPRITNMYIKPVTAVTNEFIERIKHLRDSKSEMPDDFMNELKKWSLESIALIAFDKRLGCLEPNLAPDSVPQKMIMAAKDFISCTETLEMRVPVWKIISTPTWRKFVKTMDFFLEISSKFINETLEKMRKRGACSDHELSALERILLRTSANPKVAYIMAMDMLMAGVDTTAINSSNAMYLLAKNPDKQEYLYQELKRFLPNRNDNITAEMLEDMKYLKACLKESLRIYGISTFNMRGTTSETVIGNYRIPKNVNLMMANALCGMMEEYFPQASRFMPERWLKHRPGHSRNYIGSAEDYDAVINNKPNPFLYLPFGFGARMCIGKRFAEMETAILISKLVRNFKLEYNYGEMTYSSRLVHKPENPLKYKLTERTA
ncbi:hypothetical protein J437_LFUL003442 [Ladona fulva]|uniref:Cytochrome P450 n=1 Tax=Ladona fulva TaxID=123851 RepID=A0A8K0K1A1_LADFU|nr:hypothetical protein J437_LFUL003442 [Ladona fulva]